MKFIINKYSRVLFIIGLLVVMAWLGFVFRMQLPVMNNQEKLNNQLILEWQEMFLLAERKAEGSRGPIAARTYGYIGLAAYETALPLTGANCRSFVKAHLDLALPDYHSVHQFHVLAALNACYKKLFDKYFITVTNMEQLAADQLFRKWENRFISISNRNSIEDSRIFGNDIATAIYEYSATDSIGHQAYLHIYDKYYVPATGEGKWQASEEFPMPPLLPHWGKVRPFIIKTSDHLAAPLPEFTRNSSSIFYTEALEVLTVSSPLSIENKWIAEYWSDDHPGITFTPAGRWISITNQVIERECPSLEKTLETYLKIGFALTDASIACWNSKYYYSLERPETYIQKVFNKNWKPLFHTPPFPAYPSGHSILGAAAAEILTKNFGPNYQMKDNSHKGREEFMSKPRLFHSFYDMAFENAFSRIPLGVHFRMDCEEGLRMGFQIGKMVSSVELMRPDFSIQ